MRSLFVFLLSFNMGWSTVYHGINWTGFNNGTTMLDGVWEGPDSITMDFPTVVFRQKALGFNAVRLPFSFEDFKLEPRNFTHKCTMTSQEDLKKSLTNPKFPTNAPFPAFTSTAMCNANLPNDSMKKRFLWVIDYFVSQGFYVLLDNHLREDKTAIKDAKAWVEQWTTLMKEISPQSRSKVMVDLLNEPDQDNLQWSTLGPLYLQAMDALYQVNPDLQFFIQGTGQTDIKSAWGSGFALDHKSSPADFFDQLLKKPYLNNVVISPHLYPSSITQIQGMTDADLDHTFGYLAKEGYKEHRFPIIIGEIGSKFEEADLKEMDQLANYLKSRGIESFFYWSWNANSGDTGGLVKDNWRDIEWNKIDYLQKLNLKPWYLP